MKQCTYGGYRAAVYVHLIPGLGQHRLSSPRPEHLERLYVRMLKIQTRRGTTMSPGRAHQVHRAVRTALNEAVRRGHIRRSPAEVAKTRTGEEHEVVPYSVEEVRRIFTAAGTRRNGTRWLVALALGLRQGEVLGLQWGDVEWDRAVLTVRRSRTRPRYTHGCKPSCGHKYAGHSPARDARPTTDSTKSRAGRRIVPLPAAIVELLRVYAVDHAAERQKAAQLWTDGGWIFATGTGDPINPRTDWGVEDLARRGRRAGRPAAQRAAHGGHRAPAPRRPRAGDHEHPGLVVDGDGESVCPCGGSDSR